MPKTGPGAAPPFPYPFPGGPARILAAAVWIWWIALGAWPRAGVLIQASGLALTGLAAWALSRASRKRPASPPAVPAASVVGTPRGGEAPPFRSLSAAERLLLAAPLGLILNTFAGPHWGLPPRLSVLTFGPLLWTASFLIAEAPRLLGEPASSALAAAYARLGARLARRRAGLAAAFAAAYLAWFSAGAILRIRAFALDFWDMGSIAQAMAHLARGGGFVSGDPAGFVEPRYGGHLEGVLVLLSSLMRWRYGDMAVCILQIAAALAAAWAMGRALERWTGRAAGFWAGYAGMALHPALAFPLGFDFHADVFAVLPLALMAWAWAAGNRRAFWLSGAAALACSEMALVAACGFGLMRAWDGGAAERRRGLGMAAACAALFALIVFGLMPLFKSPGAGTVAANSLGIARQALQSGWAAGGPAAAAWALLRWMSNPFHLSDAMKALAALPAAAIASPFAWLGAWPGLAKDLLCGFDLSTHHFAPSVAALYAGLGLAARRLDPERRAGALAQAVAAAWLAAFLWGPTPFSSQGRASLAAWAAAARADGGKLERVRAALPPYRNRIVTGGLGGIAFDAPAMAFLGATGRDRMPAWPDADVALELWDQPFTGWAPFGRMAGHLRALAPPEDTAWLWIASGVLCRPCAAVPRGNGDILVRGAAAPDSAGGARTAALSAFAVPLEAGRAYALVALDPDGRAVPLGLRAAGSEWIWFTVRLRESPGPLRAQLRASIRREGDGVPIRDWSVAGQADF